MNFLYCFDNEIKNRLEAEGFSFIKETKIGDKQAFLFMNNNNKINFAKEGIKVFFTNKLTFERG